MGTFVEKYRVLEKIGEGSFSEVLKCEDKVTGAQYAAKRLKKFLKSAADAMNCAEIVAMHKLARHPNVVYMLEFFYDPTIGSLIYVFELMDLSMYDYMRTRRRPLPEPKAKWYLLQVLKGLEHLHKNGLFHRDVKPENILSEIVKLADLGSIRGVYSRQPYTEYISTRWYRSPECLLSVGYYGPKMDIWAAGCVFYEMLTLQPLFPGTNEIDQLSKIHAVLGTPSTRLIAKIKKRSHNCQNFPRQIGCGLKVLMSNFSEDALTVLKLMVQYDPDTRINVRRLVDHRYFSPLRQQYLLYQFRFNSLQTDLGLERCNRGRGDHEGVVNCLTNSDRWRQNKYGNVAGRLVAAPSKPSKPSRLDGPPRKGEPAARGAPASPRKERKYVHRFQQTVRTHPPNEAYRKTTTNLPGSLDATADEKHFYSKSLVIPRRAKFKADGANNNGTWTDRFLKLNLLIKK